MSFNAHQIQYLQRLVSDRPEHRRAGEIATYLCEHYSLGSLVGSHVHYRPNHHARAAQLLAAHDLPVTSLGASASRATVVAFGGLSEKAMSTNPHAHSIALKCIGACSLDRVPLRSPEGAYIVATPDMARRITCDRLMVVENLETFRCLERYGWIDYQGLAVLAVFRGDPTLSTKDALDLVRARAEPIWAFFDFDPAGLAIALALPYDRLEKVIHPDLAWLRDAANTARGRQLFDAQEAQAHRLLDHSDHPAVRPLWAEMRALRSGVTQERMQHAPSSAREAELVGA